MYTLKTLPLKKDTLIIIYKILHDALLLLLLSFIAMLVTEGALPGFISSHISFVRFILAILIIIGMIVWIGSDLQITYPKPSIKKNRLLPALVLLAFLLIGNSLLKFAFWENMLVALITLFIFFLLYELIFDTKK